MTQKIIYELCVQDDLDNYFDVNGIKKFFLVCDNAFDHFPLKNYFEQLTTRKGIIFEKFSDFTSNPTYDSVLRGIEFFRKGNYSSILAVGGGSAIDVAKCIKLFCTTSGTGNNGEFLLKEPQHNEISLLAIPTTAGTGSEATKYAVIYYENEKQSITHPDILPQTVYFYPTGIATLPLYHKKSTSLDALCHCIESFWSINSTDSSKEYAKKGIGIILENISGYINNDRNSIIKMQEAAYLAGKAINISQTTAGHAMCYKLTSLFGISHGHAAALCVKELWPWMLKNIDKCIDKRGESYLSDVFDDLTESFHCTCWDDAVNRFQLIFDELDMMIPSATEEEMVILCNSVNPVRLKNNPILLDKNSIQDLYYKILRK